MTPVLEAPVESHEFPCAELHTTERKFVIEVEAPGCRPEDLEVEVEVEGADQCYASRMS